MRHEPRNQERPSREQFIDPPHQRPHRRRPQPVR
jgi:hypothetical protein